MPRQSDFQKSDRSKARMITVSGFIALCLSIILPATADIACRNIIYCPCGNSSSIIKLCHNDSLINVNICNRWSRCSKCFDDVNRCIECPEGFSGEFCNSGSVREKRQLNGYSSYSYYSSGPQSIPFAPLAVRGYLDVAEQNPRASRIAVPNFVRGNNGGGCPTLSSPDKGGIRCTHSTQRSSCTGKCLPGYVFKGRGTESEMTLTCTGSGWTPLRQYPPCVSRGYCELINEGAGSYNCSIDMSGKRCLVWCSGTYIGEYFCYPGQQWRPPLPYCVRPNEPVTDDEHSCHCEYGRCDHDGHCICPVGRTGLHCETVIPEKRTCPDPGFITNGIRRVTDGSISSTRRNFKEGDYVMYSCTSTEYALQGSSIVFCERSGRWSEPLPKCIKPSVAPTIFCPDPGHVANGDRFNSDGSPSTGVQRYREGQSVVYSCHQGFALQPHSIITCTERGTWSKSKPSCERNSPAPVTRAPIEQPGGNLAFCRDPGIDPNGERTPRRPQSNRGFLQGRHLKYSCKPGYELVGEKDIFCLLTGKWSSTAPTCQPQSRVPDGSGEDLEYCVNPGPIENGKIEHLPTVTIRRRTSSKPVLDDLEFPEGSTLRYSCDSGYELEGDSSITCSSLGTWSAKPPSCKNRSGEGLEFCANPGPIENGKFVHLPTITVRRRTSPQPSLDDLEFPEGSTLGYSCDSGYTLEGASSIACTSLGTWSEKPPSCKKDQIVIRYCGNPGRIENGGIVHIPLLSTRRRGEPPKPILEDPEFPQGSRLEYYCDIGYTLRGAASIRCLPTGSWTASPPTCRKGAASIDANSCKSPGIISNGRAQRFEEINNRLVPREDDDPNYPVGTRMEYSCNNGYKLEGSFHLVCQASGTWSEPTPKCISECGHSYIQLSRKVVNGTKSEAGEWPWVVGLSVRQNGSSSLICGGALINPTTVITAAHCVVEETLTLYFGKIFVNENYDDSEVQIRISTQIIKHPNYNSSNFDSDIALIRFSPVIRYSLRVQPICLPTEESQARNLMTGKQGYVTGFGITEKNTQAEELMFVLLPVVSSAMCVDSYRSQGFQIPMTDNMFCAGLAEGQRGACTGDSGSPLIFFDRNKVRHYVEGIVSFATLGQCALPGRYTIFTKVYAFLPWIMELIV